MDAPAAQAPRARAALRASTPAATALAALLAAGALGGCTFTNDQLTQQPYIPSDGQDVSLDDEEVKVGALMVVTEDEGAPGRLVARVVNDSAEPRTVIFTGDGLDERVEAPPGTTVAIGEPNDPEAVDVVIDAVATAPGLLMPMTVGLEDGGSVEVGVPVLDGTLAEYEPYLPEPSGVAGDSTS